LTCCLQFMIRPKYPHYICTLSAKTEVLSHQHVNRLSFFPASACFTHNWNHIHFPAHVIALQYIWSNLLLPSIFLEQGTDLAVCATNMAQPPRPLLRLRLNFSLSLSDPNRWKSHGDAGQARQHLTLHFRRHCVRRVQKGNRLTVQDTWPLWSSVRTFWFWWGAQNYRPARAEILEFHPAWPTGILPEPEFYLHVCFSYSF
jgi:hypothetical protein